ncbi:SDR family oxidoreductase [Amycolatopsis sp. NPDC006131]|uniref:SDR family oxidoreductase n=1 Tax=Amycolatopsis sp. NPDC006131 TaxID=3156731 RepID=UPI00339FF7A5
MTTSFTSGPGQLAYVACKGALIGMTRVMARELGEHHITINAVMPPQVATPGTRARSGEPGLRRSTSPLTTSPVWSRSSTPPTPH